MAPDRRDGDGVQAHELPADAERDLREVLRSKELPAQWQQYSRSTREELLAGRVSLGYQAMWRWADEGVTWLNKQFSGKGLIFTTSIDIEKREVLFGVWRLSEGPDGKLFEVIEPIESFVSPTTLTKIILIAG